MIKKLFVLIPTVFLISCSTTRPPHPPHHAILGTTWGFSEKVEILLDAQIDKLQIRHVRRNSEECVSGFIEHLEISGEIGPDSTEAVKILLPQLHKCISKSSGNHIVNNVYLSSRGGFLSDGFAMGRLFREYKVQTRVTNEQVCASSCAIAFLGGIYRTMKGDGKLMFHAPYTTDGFRSIYGGLSIDCSDRGQVSDLANYYNSVLGEDRGAFLLKRTMDYCSSSDGWTLNADAARLLGLLRD